MKTEVEYAVNFLTATIVERLPGTDDKTTTLKEKLTNLLVERFEGHWYPEKPMKGSAYRCMNISIDDGAVDAVLRKAVEECGYDFKDLFVVFNKGLALWVDPNDVSCKLGKGAIFPIYRKIADKKSHMIKPITAGFSKHRPQQRPRSNSPPHDTYMTHYQQHYQRSRSTTPPGFSSLDAGQLFQNGARVAPNTKPSSMENIHKLWNTLPNTTSSNYTMHRAPVNYTSPQSSYQRADDVYSFNQYSSYYKPNSSYWKKSTQVRQQTKPMWQADVVYNQNQWSKTDANVLINQTYDNASSYNSYWSSRQAQEVY